MPNLVNKHRTLFQFKFLKFTILTKTRTTVVGFNKLTRIGERISAGIIKIQLTLSAASMSAYLLSNVRTTSKCPSLAAEISTVSPS